MRKKSALAALLAATVLCISSVCALESAISLGENHIGLSAKGLFLHPMGKGIKAQVKVSNAFMMGPHLHWRISDDLTLTSGGYFCVQPVAHFSNFGWKEILGIEAVQGFFARNLGDPNPDRDQVKQHAMEKIQRLFTATFRTDYPTKEQVKQYVKQAFIEAAGTRSPAKAQAFIDETLDKLLPDSPISGVDEALDMLLANSLVRYSVSLRQHVPIVFGAEYNLYSSDIFSLEIFGSVGLGIWTAKAAARVEPIKAELLFESEGRDSSVIGFGGLKFGFKLGSATIALSGGYGYFGKPDIKWNVASGLFLPGEYPEVHGLIGSVEIGLEF